MKILVAMDSFKGSLTAREACGAVAQGLHKRIADAEIVTLPMADGGEGTAETLLRATGGEWVAVDVTGPLPGMRAHAGFARLGAPSAGAFVEMATASGLELLAPHQRDPMRATTYGTGELLSRALEGDMRSVWLAIGGSATVDGGTGAARALGWRFLDRRGDDVPLGGRGLEEIATIVPPPADAQSAAGSRTPYARPRMEVLCDVENPLLGARGAARVFGPQKGATPEMVERLEGGLANLADLIQRDLGRDIRDLRGAGAAGGLGAGAVAFLDATLVPGVEAVMDAVGLDAALAGAEWVVTGEGRLDEQSMHGKVVSGVTVRARRAGSRVAVVAGTIGLEATAAHEAGIEVMVAAAPEAMPLPDALARGAELVEAAAVRLARQWETAN